MLGEAKVAMVGTARLLSTGKVPNVGCFLLPSPFGCHWRHGHQGWTSVRGHGGGQASVWLLHPVADLSPDNRNSNACCLHSGATVGMISDSGLAGPGGSL